MMEIGIFTWLIDKIIDSSSLKLATDKDKNEIISALKLAIMETEKHIEIKRDAVTGKDQYSTQLMNTWNKVGRLIRPYDRCLAKLFDSKSEYWFNPQKFINEIQDGKRQFNFRFKLSEVKKIENELNKIWFA
jgi:hypothetical protein